MIPHSVRVALLSPPAHPPAPLSSRAGGEGAAARSSKSVVLLAIALLVLWGGGAEAGQVPGAGQATAMAEEGPAAGPAPAGVELDAVEGVVYSREVRPVIAGRAPPGVEVEVTVGETSATATAGANGGFRVEWPEELASGVYRLRVVAAGEEPVEAALVVQPPGRLPLRPLLSPPTDYALPDPPPREDFQEATDRWRIVPPPQPYTEEGSRWDPYHQNPVKGDRPIGEPGSWGEDVFFVFTGISDSLAEANGIPIPSGVSADRPGSIRFFGRESALLGNQNVALSFDLFRGDTVFRPVDWRVKATLVGNVNYLGVEENAVVKPDVRRGTTRTDGRGSVQEAFVEAKLADLSPNFDFVSVRAGVQPFSSDFRGFVFTDMNLGVRLFGNYHSNRTQYNLAFFERLEKDTNSGLNTFELREQQVAVANVYRQDFLAKGYTAQASVHYLRDEPTFFFDRNGFLVRPDPVGSFTPHEIEAVYLGVAGFGHVGRINLDHALYYVFGDDSLNPIAGPERIDRPGEGDAVDIEAVMAALELSYDRDWYRPKIALFYASGDDDPLDRTARGFDAIFDNPAFAGGGFSYWNRIGIRLGGTGTALVHRGSLLPDLSASKDEGQPNFVNPGLLLGSLGLDIEATPELKLVATANYLRFDTTAPIELLLLSDGIDEEIGLDVSLGGRWRPFLNENVVVVAGGAAFFPGDGFAGIYEEDDTLYHLFTNLVLVF